MMRVVENEKRKKREECRTASELVHELWHDSLEREMLPGDKFFLYTKKSYSSKKTSAIRTNFIGKSLLFFPYKNLWLYRKAF